MIDMKAIVGTLQAEMAADSWWNRQPPEAKKAYIKAHPRSKYAKQAIKAAPGKVGSTRQAALKKGQQLKSDKNRVAKVMIDADNEKRAAKPKGAFKPWKPSDGSGEKTGEPHKPDALKLGVNPDDIKQLFHQHLRKDPANKERWKKIQKLRGIAKRNPNQERVLKKLEAERKAARAAAMAAAKKSLGKSSTKPDARPTAKAPAKKPSAKKAPVKIPDTKPAKGPVKESDLRRKGGESPGKMTSTPDKPATKKPAKKSSKPVSFDDDADTKRSTLDWLTGLGNPKPATKKTAAKPVAKPATAPKKPGLKKLFKPSMTKEEKMAAMQKSLQKLGKVGKPGSLHTALGVPHGTPLPVDKLLKLARSGGTGPTDDPYVKKARMACSFRGIHWKG